jgi:magnesium-transporting ATPase (P-type)
MYLYLWTHRVWIVNNNYVYLLYTNVVDMSLLSPTTDTGDLYASVSSARIDQPQPEGSASKKTEPSPNTPTTSSIRMIMIQGIFLLILAVSGNFVAETMSCQAQKILSENMYVKHGIIVLITYFSLGFASGETNISPMELFKQAVSIWAFFLMFNKMEMFFTAIVVAMLATLLICKNYITYYQKQDAEKNKEIINTLTLTMDYLFSAITLTTIVGFGLYFKKQHTDYFSTFSYSKFLFGTPKCSNF